MKGIYAYWDNKLSQYVYIGKDSNIYKNSRHSTHMSPTHYNDQPINSVIQNNPERYEYRVLMRGDYNDKQLNKMERFCIKHFKTFYYDYPERKVFNFTKGGDGTTGYKMSEKQKEEKRQMMSNNNPMYNPDFVKKQVESRNQEEINKKISESHTGKIFDEEVRYNMSKSRNTSGYMNVSKIKDKNSKNGYYYRYRVNTHELNVNIKRTSIEDLEKEVKAKGLEWRKIE